MGWGLLDLWTPIVGIALFAYWVSVTIVVITDDKDPTSTLAWLLVLVAFPLVGLPFYYFLGRNWKKRRADDPWRAEVHELAEPVMGRIRQRYANTETLAEVSACHAHYGDVSRLITRAEGSTVLPAYEVELLINGEAKFAALKQDLAAATDTIDLQYYVWERDKLTAELAEILLGRLAAGVEVRMLNDLVGNLAYKKDEIKRLRAAGARIYDDVIDLGKINYRDHRKIVVIDGRVGYTGGINVGQEYIDGGSRFPTWRDTHVRFCGPAVAELQKLFAIRWHARTGESLFTDRFFPAEYPECGRSTLTQTVSSGVEQAWDPARRAYMVGFSAARERVWIQSPYLVPMPDVYSALINAALAGLDVRVMMTGWPDKRIAWYAAETFFSQLIDAGVKVYRYNGGFMHAKTMTIDGEIVVVGTMNLDVRSMSLNQELMTWFYDSKLAQQHEAVYLADIEQCELVTRQTIDSWSGAHRLRNAGARLVSNLM